MSVANGKPCTHVLYQRQIGQRISSPLQKKHRSLYGTEVIGSLCPGSPGSMQWKSIENQTLYKREENVLEKYCDVILPPNDFPAAKSGTPELAIHVLL